MSSRISVSLVRGVFDGKEDDFYDFACEIIFPKTGEKVSFVNLKAKAIWEANDQEKSAISSGIKSIKEFCFEQRCSYKYENLGIYFQPFFSATLGMNFFLVIASGESQPARFKIKLLGFVESFC